MVETQGPSRHKTPPTSEPQVCNCLTPQVFSHYLVSAAERPNPFLLPRMSNGFSQEIPIQTPVSITMYKGTARLQCHFKDVSENFDNTVIHWYQQKEKREPVRMLYISSGTTITLSTVSGYYYEVFGSGTKLIVSDKGNSKPENSEILQTKHKDQLLYVCLIENFYPEVIRVQWVDGADKEVTKNVVKGDVWKSTNDKYSVSTWLTLPVNMTNKNYFCKYDHESQENFKLPIQGIYSLWTHSLKGTGKAPS
uniref:Ig-like domain-containing protein n=1 Tax=Anser brachyrhynchus TaxID=132585 RepID=A0A8B9C6N8_9AVES